MAISPREFAEQVVRQLTNAGFTAFWAGGCVRDLLVGREPRDYDVATSARPGQVREVFGKRRTFSVGESFGVIVVLGPKSAGQVDVATFRSDGNYIDGRRPESVVFSSPEEDAQRRDFTINGMFYDPIKKEVMDFVGGEQDLVAGVVRAIGDPHARMKEDKLRMLRAVRFAATFDFELDVATAEAVQSMSDQISVVSAERVAQELRRMLVDRHRGRAVELCNDAGLLLRIIPELKAVVCDRECWTQFHKGLASLVEPDFALVFGLLLDSAIGATKQTGTIDSRLSEVVGRRLKLANQEIDDAAWLLRHRRAFYNAADLPLSRLKRILANPLAPDLIALVRARTLAKGEAARDVDFCEHYLKTTGRDVLDPSPLISGDDLIKAGFRPGPKFKDVLDRVRDAQLNLQISNAAEALELAAQFMPDND